MSAEDFHKLAAQEAALAREAVTNESRAQHHAMAAYYSRLAEAKEKIAATLEIMTGGPNDAWRDAHMKSKHPGQLMTLGNMRSGIVAKQRHRPDRSGGRRTGSRSNTRMHPQRAGSWSG
jgi:hypothetical protein